MKKIAVIILIIIVIIVIGCIIGFNIMSKKCDDELSKVVITDINLSKIPDGSYSGNSSIFPVSVEVKVDVTDHEITRIKIIKHNNGKGSQAETITQKVLNAQSLKVDVISGATISSKAILKAIQNALSDGN